MDIKKAYNIADLKKRTFDTFPFRHEFLESFGTPERNGVWLIWGHSGHGKTRLALQLAKYLAGFTKVYYNTREEGTRLSFLKALEQVGMEAVGKNFQFQNESYNEMNARISRKRSAKVVFIDSLQYLRINLKQYIELKEAHPDKLFIITSHATNNEPKGAVANSIMYDVDVKIFVKDFIGNIRSRFGGNAPYTIWEEGAKNATLELT